MSHCIVAMTAYTGTEIRIQTTPTQLIFRRVDATATDTARCRRCSHAKGGKMVTEEFIVNKCTIKIGNMSDLKKKVDFDMYQPPINEPCDTTKCKECVLLYLCKTKTPKTLYIDLI